MSPSALFPGVLAHELGHNLGLLHANYLDCRTVAYVVDLAGCDRVVMVRRELPRTRRAGLVRRRQFPPLRLCHRQNWIRILFGFSKIVCRHFCESHRVEHDRNAVRVELDRERPINPRGSDRFKGPKSPLRPPPLAPVRPRHVRLPARAAWSGDKPPAGTTQRTCGWCSSF
jgi:hypothetical protein